MSMNDQIADMLTRIRNAVAVRKPNVSMPSASAKVGIAEVLKREGYITDFHFEDASPQNLLVLDLKYGPEGEKVIEHIERTSTPGCRVYVKAQDIEPVLNGLGISIISTNRGIVSDREAREQNVGGEVMATLW